MATYIALLRGINVSGKNKILMTDLKQILQELKLKDVITYIQSGNVIFKSDELAINLSKTISAKILETFNYNIPVFILNKKELQHIYNNNPFVNNNVEFKKLYFCFINKTPINTIALSNYNIKNDQYKITNKVLYLKYENGAGKTKLTNKLIENKLQVIATSRNYKTITKLLELT